MFPTIFSRWYPRYTRTDNDDGSIIFVGDDKKYILTKIDDETWKAVCKSRVGEISEKIYKNVWICYDDHYDE